MSALPDPLQYPTLHLITTLSRDPFRRALKTWLDAAPDADTIRAAAKKSPDRWAQGLTLLGKLAGYSEKLEMDLSGHVDVRRLSDLELDAKIAVLRSQIAQTGQQSRLTAIGPPPPRLAQSTEDDRMDDATGDGQTRSPAAPGAKA
jgi:hypothetical protein